MKLFRTFNIEIVHYCRTVCGCELPSVLLGKQYEKFVELLFSLLRYVFVVLCTFRYHYGE